MKMHKDWKCKGCGHRSVRRGDVWCCDAYEGSGLGRVKRSLRDHRRGSSNLKVRRAGVRGSWVASGLISHRREGSWSSVVLVAEVVVVPLFWKMAHRKFRRTV